MKKGNGPQMGFLRGKKVLVMGLGLHGGGVGVVRWLTRRGAKVTVTDLRDKKTLSPSLRALRGLPVRYVLGRHQKKDFCSHDVLVVGPGVPRESPFLSVAKKAGVTIENDASLFFRSLDNPIIAVTGTRGKTTTTLWIAEFLKRKYPDVRQSGTPENAELKEFERIKNKNIPAVVELSSWQLEYLPQSGKAPHIAAITNIYPEHLNRYRNIKHYADAKANIFRDQRKEDALVLNYDDPWHEYFLQKKPKSKLYFTSRKTLPKNTEGAFVRNGKFVLRISEIHHGVTGDTKPDVGDRVQGRTLRIDSQGPTLYSGFGLALRGRSSTTMKEHTLFSVTRFMRERGEHNLENLLRAVLLAKLYYPQLRISERGILGLPTPRMRQEVIYKEGRLTVVNDSAATSPDGTVAAIRRFSQLGNPTSKLLGRRVSKFPRSDLVLIAGGTDKNLEFDGLAKEIKKHVPQKRLILLEGSATTKLIAALRKERYFTRYEPLEYLDLASCVAEAFRIARQFRKGSTGSNLHSAVRDRKNTRSDLEESIPKVRPCIFPISYGTIILFSPGAASFEKFLHEFDRGRRFNVLAQKYIASRAAP